MEILPILHAPPPYPIQEPAAKRQKKLLLDDPIDDDDDDDDDHAALSNAVFRHLLKDKKLSLVLDLDHTLLHSSRFENLTPEEQYLIRNQTHDPKVLGTVISSSGSEASWVTKLRPGLAHFLEEASKLFRLHIYTRGSLPYALKMLDLIDPGRLYFETLCRVFALPNKQKSLELVVGEPRGILIVDDLESVWKEKDRENLVVIPPYHFFSHSKHGAQEGRGKSSQLVMGTDESETEGHLSSVLLFLELIHDMFFDMETDPSLVLEDRDVRKLKMDLYIPRVVECSSRRTTTRRRRIAYNSIVKHVQNFVIGTKIQQAICKDILELTS